MERILLKEISARPSAYDGERVTVAGWARTIRDSKAFGFIELNDGSCFKNTQVVFERARCPITTKSRIRTSVRRSS